MKETQKKNKQDKRNIHIESKEHDTYIQNISPGKKDVKQKQKIYTYNNNNSNNNKHKHTQITYMPSNEDEPTKKCREECKKQKKWREKRAKEKQIW